MIIKKIREIFVEVFVILMSLTIIIPLFMLLMNSFKNKAEAAEMNLNLPSKWNIIENYTELIETAKILTGIKNSLVITSLSIVLIIIFVSLSSFILQRRKDKLAGRIYSFLILGLMLPAFIVPQVLILKTLHIKDIAGVILLNFTGNISLSTFLYVGYYKSIPREMDESAIIDGCNLIKLFLNIIFPLVKPVTVTLIIILALTIWNDFGTSVYLLIGPEKQTLTLSMFYFFGPHSADWNLVFACIVVTILPVVVLYLFLQKHIVAGMTAGAVKG